MTVIQARTFECEDHFLPVVANGDIGRAGDHLDGLAVTIVYADDFKAVGVGVRQRRDELPNENFVTVPSQYLAFAALTGGRGDADIFNVFDF